MTPEQINEIKIELNSAKLAVQEIEFMLADYEACKSEVSKKYLAAAIKKQTAELPNSVKIQVTE